MKARVTITDLTRMQEDRVCVAGYLRDLTCVRPVLAAGSLHEWWLYAAGAVVVRPFAVVEFDVQRKAGHAPHTEDRVIDPLYRINRGLLPPDERPAFLGQVNDAHVAAIFGAPIRHDEGWYILAGEGTRSLGTVRAAQVEEVSCVGREGGRRAYHLAFQDEAGARYRLSVTDLAFRYCLDYLCAYKGMAPAQAAGVVAHVLTRKALVYLRIGLSRGWEKHPDRCYLQITGVYSFPDYLQGKCFADLTPQAQHGAGAQ